MTPYLQDADVTLFHGDVLDVLREMRDESVDCCVTSPPYWGLRDYGTGAWDGGDEGCDHKGDPTGNERRTQSLASFIRADSGKPTGGGGKKSHEEAGAPYRDTCGKCGATRIDQQLGLEPAPEEYVERMVEVFREVRRVLAAHGTVWLNLGDSYASQGGPLTYDFNSILGGPPEVQDYQKTRKAPPGLKPKDLVGIPWRVAFALQADGWWLRSAITWCKPNCMPESVTDRPTKATEMVFLLTKAARYYYDAESTRESSAHATGRTNGTAPSSPTLRPELRATLNADDGTADTWGWCDLGELEITVASSVAGEAQRLQILKPVGLHVGVEAPEGPLVVNLDGAGIAATDATMPVALASGLSLLSPVWASIVDATSAPCGAVLADHVGSDPTTAALARAEVTALKLTRVASEWLAAEMTLESEELSATLLVWGTSGASHPRNTNENVGRNARDWWLIPTQPYPMAHFATFPEELARRCIAAGCPEQVCRVCGKARERVVERGKGEAYEKPFRADGRPDDDERSARNFRKIGGGQKEYDSYQPPETLGFTDCGHDSFRPGIVLDPFAGSGTTMHVARKLGRHSIGIDLSAEYLALAARRLAQQSLLTEGVA